MNSLAQLPLLSSVLSSNLWEAFLQHTCRSCTPGLLWGFFPASRRTPQAETFTLSLDVSSMSVLHPHPADTDHMLSPLTGTIRVSLVSFCCKTHTLMQNKKVFSSPLSWSQPNLFSASLLPENFKLPVQTL